MKTILLLFTFAFVSLTALDVKAQAYKTGFDNSSEQANWIQYRTGTIDPFYEWEFSTFDAHSAPNCVIHNYPVGGTEVSDDWFVSPVFDFSEGGQIDSVWHNFSGFGTPSAGDTIAIYVLNGSSNPALATSKTMLLNYADTSYVNDNIWKLRTNIAVPNLPGESYIAFRYTTTNNWLDVKFDDLSITSNTTTGLDALTLKNDNLHVFPNPTTNIISINLTQDLGINSISVLDLSGKEIKQFSGQETTLNISELAIGSYILKVNTDEGVLVQKILKN